MKPLKIKVSITLDDDIVHQIKILSEQDDRSFSQYINMVLKQHIAKKEKALAEYRKFQVKTLSSVEQAYLESIKGIEKKAKRGGKKQ